LQVVMGTHDTQVTSSSSTFADTGLTASITPTSTTSKVLVFVNQNGISKATNDTYLQVRLLRGATNIIDIERYGGVSGNTNEHGIGSISTSFLDTPATTSSTTYKTQFASQGNNAVVRVQTGSGGVNSKSTIILMEIGA
jgi:hypothetical protein